MFNAERGLGRGRWGVKGSVGSVVCVWGRMFFRKFQIAFSEINTVRDGLVPIFGNNIRTGMRL